ncbi:hypothetical protein [Paenibacillus kobensis]|uniref:hypothetical protein n=1 Tax=Paenibacillus kobensis TaxID=59841 RepID=UPI000FD9B1DE|nr:hypothetical protein [Paenibacillus kobensis]
MGTDIGVINNNTKVRLPIAEPIIDGYKHHSLPLSILSAYPHLKPVIYTDYIQLYTIYDVLSNPNCDRHWLDFCIHNYITEMNPNPFFNTEIFDLRNIESISDFIESSLRNNYYIYIFYNGYYRETTTNYKKQHVPNNMLIYGLDNEEDCYDVYDINYMNSTKLEMMKADKQALIESIVRLTEIKMEWLYRVAILKPIANLDHQVLDVGKVHQGLNDYLYSKNTFERFARMSSSAVMSVQKNARFGLEVYDVVDEYVQRSSIRNNVSMLPFLILWEHKKVLKNLFVELFALEKVSDSSGLQTQIENIEKESQALRNLILKYSATGNRTILHNLRTNLEKMKLKEAEFIEGFMNSLLI